MAGFGPRPLNREFVADWRMVEKTGDDLRDNPEELELPEDERL